MNKIVNVLWAGGLDSTCRIAELSRQEVVVQPYYVIDRGRGSIKNELKAISIITKIIRENQHSKCELKDVKTIELSSLKTDETITNAWKTFHEKYMLGSQYDWLARFAKQNDLTLEIGLENSPRSKAMKAILSESKLIQTKDDSISEYMIDVGHSSKEAVILFENLRIPSTIWNMTKLEEVGKMKSLGLDAIIDKTWFCHYPIFGLTCGHCNPCKDALKEGMSYRVSKLGYILGIPRAVLKRIYKFVVRRK